MRNFVTGGKQRYAKLNWNLRERYFNVSGEKKQYISRKFQMIALEMLHKGEDTFTVTAFHRNGIGKSTIDYRINSLYKLIPNWERKDATHHRRTYKLMDLIAAMKREGDWV